MVRSNVELVIFNTEAFIGLIVLHLVDISFDNKKNIFDFLALF